MQKNPLINIATQAALVASKTILRFMDRVDTLNISEKTRNDLVTEVDLMAEQEIIQQIQKSYPQHSILAEESGKIEGNEICWIIDPLDGTMNYVHSFPHFAVSIAIKKNDNLEAGIIYDPIRQELFSAARGEGAYLNQRRIRVSNTKNMQSALIGTGFPFRKNQEIKPYLKLFESILTQASGMRRAGSAALDLAYVAAGRLDGFWESALNEWDIAAGALLIQEAGGIIADFDGKENYFSNGNVIAGNPKIQDLLQKIVVDNLQ